MVITQNLSSGHGGDRKIKNFKVEGSACTMEKDPAASLAQGCSPTITKKDYILENSLSQGSTQSKKARKKNMKNDQTSIEENISIMVLAKPASLNKQIISTNSMLRQGNKSKSAMKKVRIVKPNHRERASALEKSAQKGHKQLYKPPVIENQCFSAFSIQPSSKEMTTLAIQKGLKEKYGRVIDKKNHKVIQNVPQTPPIQSPHQSKENFQTQEVETLSKSLRVNKTKQQNLDLPFSDQNTMKLQPDEGFKTSFTGHNSNKSFKEPEAVIKCSKGSNFFKYQTNPISNGTKEL